MRALLVLLLGCASAAAASFRLARTPRAEQGTSEDNNIDTLIVKEHEASATTHFDNQLKLLKHSKDLHQTQDAVLYRTRREGSRSEAAGGGPSLKGAEGGGAGGRGRARLLVQAAPAPCARASSRLCPSEVYEFVLWPGDDRKRL